MNCFADAMSNTVELKQSKAALNLIGCPPPSRIFQGRGDILQKMDAYFSEDIGRRHVYILYGLGGSGKTQIALKFLDMKRQRFTKQFFINASSCQTLDTAFKNIAISQKIGTTLEDVLLWLVAQNEEWMLLFDEADDLQINLFPFFPKCTHGNIIITSRNPDLASYGPMSHSKVGDMQETEAIGLLLSRAVKEKNVQNIEKASEIVKELSCLPLALVQAGAYISTCNCLFQYLSIYRRNHAKLLSQHAVQSHDDYKWTVYTTWEISFRQLSKAAARFLQLCSLLHHNSIPEAIFEHAAAWTGNNHEQEDQAVWDAKEFLHTFMSDSGTWDAQHFMDILSEIQGYSLMESDTVRETLSMHPLVHSWCQSTLEDEHVARKCIIAIVGMSIRSTDNAHLFRIRLISHLDSLIKDSLTIMPMFQNEYAYVYNDSGRWKEAIPLVCSVLERRKQLLGPDHPDTLTAMANLARIYCSLGRHKEAEPIECSVLEKRKQVLSPDHPDTLTAMANLACTYRYFGRYQEAEPLECSVLEKRKQLLGPDHPGTLRAMANLAATYRHLGKYQIAEPLGSIMVEKRKQLLGPDHPNTLSGMANLAETYRHLGRYQDAEPLDSIVLEKRKQLLGSDHPDTLQAMSNLVSTYRYLGRYQDAEPLDSIVLEKREASPWSRPSRHSVGNGNFSCHIPLPWKVPRCRAS
ncbi:P-loop containing nucleoside triphosphate hydrolase protein [Mycena olivaceomarginata]|nr:P-loop containing nucleoside triphosphate hydrolase protein [Mycena olivaceomarginata]